jgi:hypothetical protein
MHRLRIPEEGGWDSYYLCEGLCRPVFVEPEIVYPYVSGTSSEKFAFNPSSYRFMLPYELYDGNKGNKYGAIHPEELKSRYPMAYSRIREFKNQFHHDTSPLSSADYSVTGRQFLEYLYTPKIVATEGYHLQAGYDAVGNHVFGDGCGIVLKDSSKYPYVTTVLNSPIARLFPVMCRSEMIYSNYTYPAVIKRFPIVFPDNGITEDLINTISSYLTFLNKQIYAADFATNYGQTDWLQELESFYANISSLLILDTYFINDLDPRLLDAFEENIHPFAGDIESEDDYGLLNALDYIKQQILETSRFGKYRFKMGLPDILNSSQSITEY